MGSKSKMGLWTESQLSPFDVASTPAISGCAGITDRFRRSDRAPRCSVALVFLPLFRLTPVLPYTLCHTKPIFDSFGIALVFLPLFRLTPVLPYTLCHTKPIFDSFGKAIVFLPLFRLTPVLPYTLCHAKLIFDSFRIAIVFLPLFDSLQ